MRNPIDGLMFRVHLDCVLISLFNRVCWDMVREVTFCLLLIWLWNFRPNCTEIEFENISIRAFNGQICQKILSFFFLGKYASFDINLKNGLIANRLYERRFFMWKFKEDFLLPFLFIICWRCRVLPLELNWKSSFEKKTFNKIFINLKIAFSKDNIGLKFDRKRFKLWTF